MNILNYLHDAPQASLLRVTAVRTRPLYQLVQKLTSFSPQNTLAQITAL